MSRIANVVYHTEYLPQWRDSQTRLQTVFASFVVDDEATAMHSTHKANPTGGNKP